MLTTTYQLDPNLADPDLSQAVFLPAPGSGSNNDREYSQGNDILIDESTQQTITIPAGFNISAGSITIESTAATQINLNVSANITAQSISFDNNGPYDIRFRTVGSNTISGGTISTQSALTIDVDDGVSATIASSISAGNYRLVKDDFGQLNLTGAVTVGSLIDTDSGTLVLNGSATIITNGDNSGAGLWVQSSATINGSGSLTLGQTTPTPFNYDSTSTASAFTGPIGGLGGVEVTNSGTLALSNSSSTYTGGTDLGNGGTLNINPADAIGGPTAALTFTGNATLQAGGKLDLTQNITVASDAIPTFDCYSHATTLSSPIVGSPTTAIPSLRVIDSLGNGSLDIAASEALDEVTVSGGTLEVGAGGTLNLVAGGAGLDDAALGAGDPLGAGLNLIDNSVLSAINSYTSVAGTINLGTDTALRYESGETSEFDGQITGPGQLDVDQGTLIVGSAAKRLQRRDERRTQLLKQPHFPRRRHLAVENGPEAGRPRRAGRRARGHRARRNTRPWLPAHDSVDRDAWHAGERLRERDHQRHEYQQRRHGLDDRRRFVCRGDRGFDPAREDRAWRAGSRRTDDQLDLHRDGTRRRRDRVGRWRELNERLRKLQSSRHTPCAVRPLCSA